MLLGIVGCEVSPTATLVDTANRFFFSVSEETTSGAEGPIWNLGFVRERQGWSLDAGVTV